jgi:hypothetical protein
MLKIVCLCSGRVMGSFDHLPLHLAPESGMNTKMTLLGRFAKMNDPCCLNIDCLGTGLKVLTFATLLL